MIKAFVRFLFIKLLPLWLVATFVCVLSVPFLTSLHGYLAVRVWQPSGFSLNTPVQYRLLADSNDLIQWDAAQPLLQLSSYQSAVSALALWRDYPGYSQSWLMINRLLGENESLLSPSPGKGLWRPASDHYKQLVWRTENATFIDQVVQRDAREATDTGLTVQAGYVTAPLDPFGGVFLFTAQAPEPILAGAGDFTAVGISEMSERNRQLLDEIWAIDHQNWAVTSWQMLALAGLLSALPWLILRYVGQPLLLALIFVATQLLLAFLLLQQWQQLLPVIVPAMSTLFAWPSARRSRQHAAAVNSLADKLEHLSSLWVGHLLDDNKPDAAVRFLNDSKLSVPSGELWRSVAEMYEHKREYAKSVDCWRSVLTVAPGDKAAKDKIRQLKEIVDGTKTMAIAQTSSELPVGQVERLSLGRYEIARELGRGAMGIVYEAEDPKIHRKVALKVVHLKSLGIDEVEAVKQRFFREAQAAGKLNHPNIVTVYDVGEEHDVAYIAMDLLIGKPLSERISGGSIDLVQSVRWIAQAAEALAYAHEHEIIHRDVKPANMIIEQRNNRLKLTDFGVARIAGVQQTQTGIVLGSPSYMSPEQIRGDTLTGQTDIFSLGVSLYQCITGKLPFEGETLPALAYAITQSKQKSPRTLNGDVPVSMVRIVNKALNKDPAGRYASAEDMARALNNWLEDHSQK